MKVSIITVCFNSESTIRDTIQSVINQNYENIEYIIIDGVSSDGTVSVINDYNHRVSKFIQEPDEGLYDAINKGIRRSSGEIVGLLHADDCFAHEFVIEKVARAFIENPPIDAVFSDLQYVNKNDTSKVVREWKAGPFSKKRLFWGWMPPHPTLYVRKKWYNDLGLYNTNYKISADYQKVLQLFTHADFQSYYIPEVLVKMRAGGKSNCSFKNLLTKSFEDYRALKSVKFGAFGGLGALVWKNFSKLGQFLQ